MIKRVFLLLFITLQIVLGCFCQDTTVIYKNQPFILANVVVRNNFNVAAFIDYVKNDTTFYKAFRNLRVLSFSSYNDIRILDKKGNEKATLASTTKQTYANQCRTMETREEKSSGDFYDKKGYYNYTIAEMYASLFFTNGKVCNETNIVKGRAFSVKGKSGIEKHKEQLRQLFFDPGTKIPGLPFIGNKVALFDEEVSRLYDFKIDKEEYQGQDCYVFTITPRSDLSGGEKNDIVIDEMTTWFKAKTLEIIGRNYSLSYNAGVFHFDVDMQVQLDMFQDLLVPKVMRYRGNWGIIFKQSERATFTSTLFDFAR